MLPLSSLRGGELFRFNDSNIIYMRIASLPTTHHEIEVISLINGYVSLYDMDTIVKYLERPLNFGKEIR